MSLTVKKRNGGLLSQSKQPNLVLHSATAVAIHSARALSSHRYTGSNMTIKVQSDCLIIHLVVIRAKM